MTELLNLSRRKFIIATGATGLTIGVLAACSKKPGEPDYSGLDPNPEVNAWVHIDHDDTVTVRIARSEMGQGTLTGLAQLVAEELECDWEKVTTEYPTAGLGRFLHRRQQRHSPLAPICPRRRRCGSHHAGRSRRQGMGRSGHRMQRVQGRGLAQGIKEDADLWQARLCSGTTRAAT